MGAARNPKLPLPDGQVVLVKYSSGAYVTSTVAGQRASCTGSDRDAAERLAAKLYGDGARAELVNHAGAGRSLWRLLRAA